MSVFVVRNKQSGLYLESPLSCVCLEGFKNAHRFATREDAERETTKYPTWREVLEVSWIGRWVWTEDERPDFHESFQDPCYFRGPGQKNNGWASMPAGGYWAVRLSDAKRYDSPEEVRKILKRIWGRSKDKVRSKPHVFRITRVIRP